MKFTMALLICSFAGFAQAQDSSQSSDMNTSRTERPVIYSSPTATHTGFAGYLGANAGYTAYNPNLDVEGAPTSIKALVSYTIPQTWAVFDAGYGIQSQTFSQDSAMDKGISMDVMELAARYQFANHWQLGVVYNQFFDKGENFAANQQDAEFGGVQILREINIGDSFLGRIGLRGMTSLNVNNQTVNMALIDLQLGWGGDNRVVTTTSASAY